MPMIQRLGGTLQEIRQPSIRIGDELHEVKEGFVRVGNELKSFYQNQDQIEWPNELALFPMSDTSFLKISDWNKPEDWDYHYGWGVHGVWDNGFFVENSIDSSGEYTFESKIIIPFGAYSSMAISGSASAYMESYGESASMQNSSVETNFGINLITPYGGGPAYFNDVIDIKTMRNSKMLIKLLTSGWTTRPLGDMQYAGMNFIIDSMILYK